MTWKGCHKQRVRGNWGFESVAFHCLNCDSLLLAGLFLSKEKIFFPSAGN